jgi:hypothetical protein
LGKVRVWKAGEFERWVRTEKKGKRRGSLLTDIDRRREVVVKAGGVGRTEREDGEVTAVTVTTTARKGRG